MAKTRRFGKVIATLLVLAMVLSLVPVMALATSVTVTKSNSITVNSRTVTFGGSNITLTGVSTASVFTEGTNTVYETQVGLSPNSTGTSVSVSIAGGTAQSITLDSNFEGSGDFTYSGDANVIYRFNVYREAAYDDAPNGGVAYIDMPDAEITFAAASGNNATSQAYTAVSSVAGFPKNLSIRLVPNGTNFDSLTSYSYEVTSSTCDLNYFAGTYFIASFPTSGSTLTFTVTVGGNTTTYSITASASPNATSGDYIPYDFMPAAGQFANEGVGSAGWGDIYTTQVDSTTNKGILKVNTSTGVTLGYFGGSVVIDFGSGGVDNDPKNPYGVDFILYGNSFWNNSEPGCVQVAKANASGKPDVWYDLAGSYYYTSNSSKVTSIVYENPQTETDTESATTGTAVSYSLDGTPGSVTANNFHRHSFFPRRDYYVTPGYSATFPAIAKQQNTIYKYELQTGETDKYKLSFFNSVLLGVTATTTVAGTFGYADYYPVKTLGGPYAYNPYATSTIANGNGFDSFVVGAAYKANGTTTNASGGEPMDISWAVDTNGSPVYLENIRFVRVYTGVAKNNGIFGEISTEFCGAAKATAITNGIDTTVAPQLWEGSTPVTIDHLGAKTVNPGTYYLSTSASHVLVNGATPTLFSTNNYTFTIVSGASYQIITQNGNGAPFITVVKGA